MPLGALISAGAGLFGGKLQSDNVDKANARSAKQARNARKIANRRYVNQVKFAKSEQARQDRVAANNIALQKEFAQQGIKWKVEDAKSAGIHPLYALGASTHSFSPVSVGGAAYPGDPGVVQSTPAIDTGMPNALANAGQDIGRAVSAMKTPQERMSDALALENMSLQNDLIRSQIAQNFSRTFAPGTGPGMPGASSRVFGKDLPHSSHWDNAQDLADRYGEPAEWAAFPFIFGADLREAFKQSFGLPPETYLKSFFPRDDDPFRTRYFR